jgi:predicted nucleic acid-binding protein
MNYLVDTNIFLEILLGQAGRKKCEAFLLGEKGAAWISDFTLHSIGVLLFRQKRPEIFDRFAKDTLPQFTILSLSDTGYLQLAGANVQHNLDFDDAYQFSVARENKLAIATQDKDFQRVRNVVSIRLL